MTFTAGGTAFTQIEDTDFTEGDFITRPVTQDFFLLSAEGPANTSAAPVVSHTRRFRQFGGPSVGLKATQRAAKISWANIPWQEYKRFHITGDGTLSVLP